MSEDVQYLVTLRCVVTKQLTCEGGTEEEITEAPFEFAVDEVETDQIDWELIDIRSCPPFPPAKETT